MCDAYCNHIIQAYICILHCLVDFNTKMAQYYYAVNTIYAYQLVIVIFGQLLTYAANDNNYQNLLNRIAHIIITTKFHRMKSISKFVKGALKINLIHVIASAEEI